MRTAALAGMVMAAIGFGPTARAFEASICIDSAADYSAIYPTKEVPADLRQIVAVFAFKEGEKPPSQLTAKLIAVDVGNSAPPNYEVGTVKLNTSRSPSGRARYTLPRDYPVGRYRIDFLADGKPLQSVDFSVVPPLKAAPIQPDELMPLREGQEWHYAFAQRAGPHAKVTLPDIKPDADGVLRADATYRVAAKEGADYRVELLRNRQLVMTEWWTLDSRGLAVTRRKLHVGDPFDAAIKPPQILLSLPLKPKRWRWKSGKEEADFAMYGPLPFATPQGDKPGWLVVMRSGQNALTATIARRFVPGIGMVGEDSVWALRGHLVRHQTVTIK